MGKFSLPKTPRDCKFYTYLVSIPHTKKEIIPLNDINPTKALSVHNEIKDIVMSKTAVGIWRGNCGDCA